MTQTILIIMASLAILTSACSDRDTIIAPTSLGTPPAVQADLVTVSGQVTDPAGHPVAARVSVYPLRWSDVWTGAWGRSTETDLSGHYHVNAPLHRDAVYVRASKDGYVQQCAVAATLDIDTTADLVITERENALAAGLPRLAKTRHVSGTVYERRSGDRRPVSGVWVGWEPILDTVVADTFTDSAGRYRLCGLPTDRVDAMFAVRSGTNRPVWASVEAGGDAVVDFELP